MRKIEIKDLESGKELSREEMKKVREECPPCEGIRKLIEETKQSKDKLLEEMPGLEEKVDAAKDAKKSAEKRVKRAEKKLDNFVQQYKSQYNYEILINNENTCYS